MTDARTSVTAPDGTRIVVHVSGPDVGVPVVLLHGVGSSSVTYDWLLPDLEGRRVYRVDHRGHGESGHAEGTYTLPFYFDDAVQVLEEVVGRPAVLVGFSLGGMVSWRIAQRRPDLIVGVFLEDPIVFIEKTYQGPLPEILRGTIEQEKNWVTRGFTLDEAIEDLGRNPAGTGTTMADVLNPDGLRGLAVSTIRRDRGTMEAAIDSTMSQGIDTTSPLLVPAVVLAAGDAGGAAFPTEDAAVIAESHPDIELHRVDEAGHQVHSSRAGRDIYRDLLLEFIRRFDPPALDRSSTPEDVGIGDQGVSDAVSAEISLDMASDLPRLKIAMVAYPDLTVLDLVGPQAVFSTTSDIYIVARTLDPVLGDSGLAIVPTATYDQCPDDLDVLFVPGGRGALQAIEDGELLQFLRHKAETATWITAVCSGSLVLGAAGLLEGHRATTHWASHEALALFEGVTPVQERVVVDGNRFSGGGVTAGIDFGLALLAELRGPQIAQLNQLLMEYDPQPPFEAGLTRTAPPEITALARSLFGEYNAAVEAAVRRSPAARPTA